jgi:two-component system sporulation sensor kinase C
MKSKSRRPMQRKSVATQADGHLSPDPRRASGAHADYRMLVEKTHYGILVLDWDRRVLTANRAAAAMLGCEPGELTGRDLLEFVHPDWRKTGAMLLHPGSLSDEPSDVAELVILRGDGLNLPVDVSSTLIFWRGRDAVLVTVRDVTKRKQIEQALRESEHTMRSVIDLVPYPVYAKNAEGRFLLANQATARTAGCTVESLLGRKDSDFISRAEDVERIRQDDREVIHTGQPKFITEQPVHDAQGVVHVIQTSKVPISLPGHREPAVLGVVVDVTERAEIERRLREREETFRALAETAREGIIVADAQRRALYSNPEAQVITGLNAEAIIGKDLLDLLAPEGREAAANRFREVFGGERPSQRGMEIVIQPGGTSLKVELVAAKTVWFGQDALLLMFHDVTDRLRMEEELLHHQEHLEHSLAERTEYVRRMERRQADFEKLAAVSGLAGRIAHEINNPLGGVKNAILLIKSEMHEGAACAKYIQMVEKELDRMARIVRELYNLYRPGLKPTARFQVAETLAEVAALLDAECQSRSVRVQVAARPSGATFVGNEDMVRQVLFNLVKNALEVSAPGSFVVVEAEAGEDALHLSVADQGGGIPEDVRGRIFEPFFTTKLSQGGVGLGLGLPVSKNLLEAVGGSLGFETVIGQGTVFRARFPSHGSSGP